MVKKNKIRLLVAIILLPLLVLSYFLCYFFVYKPGDIERLVLGKFVWVGEYSGIARKIKNEKGFIQDEGTNFYIPNKELKAFSFKVLYVGLRGFDFLPGPNVTVEGDYETVAEAVQKQSNLPFKTNSDVSYWELSKYLKVYIYPHSTNSDWTVIQFAYIGP